MEKRVDAAVLLAFYGPLLTGRQLELLRLHYEEDLSLSEIATICGVTRQGAHDAIRRGESQLLFLEEKLGLRTRWDNVCGTLKACRSALVKQQTALAIDLIDRLLEQEEAQDGL